MSSLKTAVMSSLKAARSMNKQTTVRRWLDIFREEFNTVDIDWLQNLENTLVDAYKHGDVRVYINVTGGLHTNYKKQCSIIEFYVNYYLKFPSIKIIGDFIYFTD